MNADLLEYLYRLSATDPKTLSQKLGKTVEEVGELARTIGPYDNSAGTQHRFVTNHDILDEVADVTLCVWSIAYSLGFSDTDIETMLLRKAKHWADKQVQAGVYQLVHPYEIHITIETPKDNYEYSVFEGICDQLKVKPITLELQDIDGNLIKKDVMTSSRIFTSNRGVLEEVERIKHYLIGEGLGILRSKIETTPFHLAAPTRANGLTMMSDNYFEAHFNIRLDRTEERVKALKAIAWKFFGLFSRNVKKQDEGIISLTIRGNNIARENFEEKLALVRAELARQNFTIEDEIVEYAIYDTAVLQDDSWVYGGFVAPVTNAIDFA